MCNVKHIEISGTMPFDMGVTTPAGNALQNLLGFTLRPTVGIRLRWTGESGYKPNSHGGKTAMYRFVISGQEAVRYEWFNEVIKRISEIGGEVNPNPVCLDIEN